MIIKPHSADDMIGTVEFIAPMIAGKIEVPLKYRESISAPVRVRLRSTNDGDASGALLQVSESTLDFWDNPADAAWDNV